MSAAQPSLLNFNSRRASRASVRISVEDFEAAALPHLHELFRAATRLVGSSVEAEDLLQETYCQAWKSFHRFELGTNCRAWLFRILFNRANHHRKSLFWNKAHVCDAKSVESLRFTPPINEQLADAEILRAVARLPRCYREAVLLIDVEEYSYREAAGILRVPIGTVMSRLSRGRKLLRAALAEVAKSYGIKSATSQTLKRSLISAGLE